MPTSQDEDLFAAIVARLRLDPGSAAPISQQELETAERRLEFTLPPLLRRLYTEVDNGGFGPGDGLLSLVPISQQVDQSIGSLCHRFQNSKKWIVGMMPFAHWGCMIFSCLDLSKPSRNSDPPVLRFEPNMSEGDTYESLNGLPFHGVGLIPESPSLSQWFTDWLNDVEMFHRPYSRGAIES